MYLYNEKVLNTKTGETRKVRVYKCDSCGKRIKGDDAIHEPCMDEDFCPECALEEGLLTEEEYQER